MKCEKCGEKLNPKKNFCPECGHATKKWQETEVVSKDFRGPSKTEVNKILEDAGITSAAERSKFLGELESGIKPRDQVVVEGNVGRINI